ncbi:MAG: livG, partial [Deltaproteobacteria bacterium]|nr:livG [Deltaproteobacteria bacterium]
MSSEAILSLKEVSKSFGGLKALDTVSFDLAPGQITSLVGPNGSGKTTLFNCISGIYIPESGHIQFTGTEVTSYSAARRCKMGIGRTFQVVRPFLKMTCLENILVGWCFGQEKYQKPAASDADGILEFVGLKDRRHHQAGELRLAERKRLEIARALATQPKLLLLDEVA